MNDLRVESYVSTTDYENTIMYELGAIPIGQLTNYQAGVTVKNIGINPQSSRPIEPFGGRNDGWNLPVLFLGLRC